ncbi:putative glucan endo-1,3-beta-D-glucosidase [Rosa chinensis]|uniref:glucan endo-1,3-beta-D-glucosidase n=1 Tax=Rosa chinensis TaxID=74649 RepID=A0A2P6R3K8_ROSCH|nr:putative glucan endo-1,3-beta-D-glucosidase [Rosa chinensis]
MIPGPFAREVLTIIKSLQDKLVKIGKADMVTTSVGSSVLGASYPPSTGEFAANNLNDMKDVLRLLSAYGAPLMINVYPYYAYAADRSHVSLDYALFNATAPVVHDGELAYQNLFDAMVDSFYWAMEKAEYRNVSIVMSETGWPRTGTIPEVAETYSRNLVKRMKSGVGTPKRPNDTFGAFIYAYHDGPHDSFGVFDPNHTDRPFYAFPRREAPVLPLCYNKVLLQSYVRLQKDK